MLRQCLGASAIALGALVILGAPATAQNRGYRGGSGNAPWSGGQRGYNQGNYSPYGQNYGGRNSQYYGNGVYSPQYRQNDSYAPGYYGNGSYSQDYYSPQNSQGNFGRDYNLESGAPANSTMPGEDQTAVHITVRVAPDAEVWFEGKKTAQRGSLRRFVSPPIENDGECSYDIKARWMENGQKIERTRTVNFHAGDQLTVNFMTRSSQGADIYGNQEDSRSTSPRNEDSDASATGDQDERPSAANPAADSNGKRQDAERGSRRNEESRRRTTGDQDTRPSPTTPAQDKAGQSNDDATSFPGTDKPANIAAKDIVETAIVAGKFKILVTALQDAGMVETLKGKGPFTVFAPTDEAFAKLPKGTMETLLKDKERLTAVLQYHVMPGKVMIADLTKLDSAKTAQGKTLAVSAKGGTMSINDAKIVQADVACSNGEIHIIDTVLMPPE